jgi:hypothetical protein
MIGSKSPRLSRTPYSATSMIPAESCLRSSMPIACDESGLPRLRARSPSASSNSKTSGVPRLSHGRARLSRRRLVVRHPTRADRCPRRHRCRRIMRPSRVTLVSRRPSWTSNCNVGAHVGRLRASSCRIVILVGDDVPRSRRSTREGSAARRLNHNQPGRGQWRHSCQWSAHRDDHGSDRLPRRDSCGATTTPVMGPMKRKRDVCQALCGSRRFHEVTRKEEWLHFPRRSSESKRVFVLKSHPREVFSASPTLWTRRSGTNVIGSGG